MNQFSYLILVEVFAEGPIQDLVTALQVGYDSGQADGKFEVVVTHSGCMVTFLRSVAENDMQYLRDRMQDGAQSFTEAATLQLALELEACVGTIADSVVQELLNGDPQVVDFNGVFQRVPIYAHSGVKSISDDDVCAKCAHCEFKPGELSRCKANWPGVEDGDGYVLECGQFTLAT